MSSVATKAGLVTAIRMIVACLFLTAMQPAVAANESKQVSEDAALVSAETARFDAQIARDMSALKRGLADELVYTHASGKAQTKEEYLQGFESGSLRYQAIDVADRTTRVYGNMGVTHGVITLTVGGDHKLVSRYTGLYVKRDDRWQLVAWQATDIRTP